MKELLKSTAISIGISMTIFCIFGIVFDIKNDGIFYMENWGFSKMVLGCLFVGMGFGIPSAIYEKENLPRPMQIVIHMGIGCSIYTIVAFWVGWIPPELGVGKCILIVFLQLIAAFIIWISFMLYYRKEALSINKKLKEKK